MMSKRRNYFEKKRQAICILVESTFQSLSRTVLDLANPRVVSAHEMPRFLGSGALHDSSGFGAFDQGVLDTFDVRATHGYKVEKNLCYRDI